MRNNIVNNTQLWVIKKTTPMKHSKFDNEAKHQQRLKPKEQDTKDYFGIVMKQKKEEKTFAIIVAVLTILSFMGICMGASNLIKRGTRLSQVVLRIINMPLILILGSVIFSIFKKEKDPQKKDKTITFISVNFLVFVLIGVGMGVFHLINLGTIVAYSISALIICVVLYLVFKAVKNRMWMFTFINEENIDP